MKNIDLESKFIGGFVGSALGDSIGELAFRYHNRQKLLEVVEKADIVRYTDDTAMAIGLAESIIKNEGKIIPKRLGKQFHKNFNSEPHRGYGSGPPWIFRTVENTGKSYTEAAQELFGGDGSFGNGASMRITPLGMFFYNRKDLYNIAKKSAIVTHSHLLGIDGAAILAKLISFVVQKDPDEYKIKVKGIEILDTLIEFSKTETYSKKLESIKKFILENTDRREVEHEIGSGVLAQNSVPYVIYSFIKEPDDYRESLMQIILLSRDRDTVGAMLGGVLGSYLRYTAIPPKWVSKLENKDYIIKLAKKLYTLRKDL